MICSIRTVILRKFMSQRCFHTTQIRRINPNSVEEIRIPVPWGHIAGKWWGKKSIQPVIALHGWQDNAGSWDPVAELMPDDFSVLAIDLPGNGRSSHLPNFQSYYTNDAIAVIRRIKRHFGWDKCDILGHSGGASICFLYATVFPEDVKSFFGVDYVTYSYIDEKERASRIGDIIDKKIMLAFRDHASSSRYTWEEAKEVWIKATSSSLNDKTSEILMKRAVNKMPDGKYIFSRDHRLKGDDINPLHSQQTYVLAKNINCHVRLIRALRSDYFFDRGIKHCPNILNIIEENAKTYKLYEMDGKHHLHMDIPEEIVPLLVEVLTQEQ